MEEARPYQRIAPGCVLVDHGPVHMTVSAWQDERPADAPAAAGAQTAVRLLAQLAQRLDLARRPVARLAAADPAEMPEVLRRMLSAVTVLDEADFTPMAAVAGAFADLVKEAALAGGADRVIVNNGGDIAFCRGRSNRPVRIGIAADLAAGRITHVVDLSAGPPCGDIAGVATSGFGGRSLSKGIASAVTCFAASAALADAAATAVANATTLEHPAIERCPAETIDALTDIRGQLVTRSFGSLSRSAVGTALANGLRRGRALCERHIIAACVIFIRDATRVWPPRFAARVRPFQ